MASIGENLIFRGLKALNVPKEMDHLVRVLAHYCIRLTLEEPMIHWSSQSEDL